ncbi:hypothetical protein N5923_08785 [Erwiniaceae bacterium BAC15a-03b]|uniref:Uncharacterized protein n=1 Tax=Winslowiella arboricola TaxID=2978220 RepID=A0A9J6PJP5_9GAMM|nr:hypothetical protein [Winslowiella arboricola]MCU5771743.1 hypothetical protein [Winslowiella arboricola]MCU5777586.1 hypothetical protein [Winslowiella arboricola]
MLNNMLVTILEHKRIVVELRGDIDGIMLLNLGFFKKGIYYLANFDSEKEQLLLVEKLAAIGALFSYGHGWAPSQVMEYLKEQGKINFPYKEISWRAPGDYIIRDK